MSDILKQIQALQEQFSNLFEVEGLGNPAVDVPPSQNKIKKDRKTKDGKVELVSVEDELFPYDGNKKEQYRQKILDTINNMIQGTATLEDLLQIVRQKKAPLKEAMEVLESLEGQRTKDGKLIIIPKKITKNIKGEWKTRDRRYTEPNDKGEQHLKAPYYTDKVYVPKSDDQKVQDSIARHEKKEQKKAPLKEAMDLMEDIVSAIDKSDKSSKRKEELKKKAEDNQEKELHTLHNYKKLEGSKVPLDIELKRKETKNIKGEHETDERRVKQARSKFKKLGMFDKGYDQAKDRFQKALDAERKHSLKEAIELMEDLFSTILKQPDEKQGALVYKYHQVKNKENAGKDTYTQAKEEEKRKSKEEKGQEKTEQRKKYRGKSVEDWKLGRLMDQIARNAKNLGKVEDSATAKAVRRNAQKADLKEALSLMEAIINEVSIGKWKEAAASSLPKRKEEAEAAKAAAEKGWEEYDKVSREHPEDEPSLYRLAQANDEEAAKAGDKADHAYAVTRLMKDKADGNVSGLVHGKANANKAIKAAKKVQDKREDEFGRNPEKRTFLRSGKANQLAAADPVKSRNEADQ
jgi:hypothetical protein